MAIFFQKKAGGEQGSSELSQCSIYSSSFSPSSFFPTSFSLVSSPSSEVRLQRRCQREQEGDQRGPRPVRQGSGLIARWCVHSEESVVFSGSVAVELDSEGSTVSTCTEHYILKMLHHSSTHQWYNIPVSAQASPHNVLHFLVIEVTTKYGGFTSPLPPFSQIQLSQTSSHWQL